MEARAFVQGLHLTNQSEWRKYVKGMLPNKPPLPSDIPKAPWVVYSKRGWINLADWTGQANNVCIVRRDK